MSVEDYTRVHNRCGEPFQRGRISESAFWKDVCEHLRCEPPESESLWGEAFRAVYSPREEVFALARSLRERGYKTSLLSNTEAPAMEFFLSLGYDAFTAATFSCAEGAVKPGPEIYEVAARKLGLATECCTFIDDKLEFVEGAQAVGMKGILYQSPTQVKQDLAKLGVQVE